MDVNADVGLCTICALSKIACLVHDFRASAQMPRFNLVAHLALTNDIVLKYKTKNWKGSSPLYVQFNQKGSLGDNMSQGQQGPFHNMRHDVL